MRVVTKRIISKSRSDKFRVTGIGDVHLGNVGCNKKLLQETINTIKDDPFHYWVGMGDYCDCITHSDTKRFDPTTIDPTYRISDLSNLPEKQRNDIIKFFDPIKDRCIGLLTGNHENTIRKYHYVDIVSDMARALNTDALSYSGFIRLHFKRNGHVSEVIIYANHGYGSSRSAGGKVKRIIDTAHSFDADIIMLAHEHARVIVPPVIKLGLTRTGKIKQREQYGVMTGSFLKGYQEGTTSYVEEKGYSPCHLGTVTLEIFPEKKEIKGVL